MKKYTLVFITAFILGGCQDISLFEEKEVKQDYFDMFSMLNKKNDGYFNIQYSTVAGGQYSPNDVGKIDGNIGDGSSNYGTISFNDLSILPDENNGYRLLPTTACLSLYGKIVNVKIKEERTSFYVATPIKFTDWESGSNVYPGYTLKWNQDEANEIGVAVRLLYTSSGDNQVFKETGFSENKANYIFTEDTGEYTFKADDFDEIPQGATISLGLARGGATMMKVEGKKIRLAGISYNLVPKTKYKKY